MAKQKKKRTLEEDEAVEGDADEVEEGKVAKQANTETEAANNGLKKNSKNIFLNKRKSLALERKWAED